jgi:hypothetical protein
MQRTSVILASLGLAAVAHAQTAALVHPSPAPQEMVVLDFNGGTQRYQDLADVSMSGNRITVIYTSPGVDFPEPPPPPAGGYHYWTQLGKFPAGDYQVDVVAGQGSAPAVVATISFHVAAAAAGILPVEDHTDLWWNPQESGWGLNLVQHGSGEIFATWFVYGADGSPQWYVVPGGHWTTPIQFTGAIYQTSGPDIAGPFDPAKVTRGVVGSATFDFTAGKLQASLTLGGQTLHKTLQRQSF